MRDGKLRGIAVTSAKRSATIPELPSVSEAGFSGFEATSWFALLAPPSTRTQIIAKVHGDLMRAVAQPDVRDRIAQLGLDIVGSTPDELTAAMRTDIPKWTKIIRDAGIKPAD